MPMTYYDLGSLHSTHSNDNMNSVEFAYNGVVGGQETGVCFIKDTHYRPGSPFMKHVLICYMREFVISKTTGDKIVQENDFPYMREFIISVVVLNRLH